MRRRVNNKREMRKKMRKVSGIKALQMLWKKYLVVFSSLLMKTLKS